MQSGREHNRAAIYARVSDRSQAEEDKTSLGEQIAAMESYCERSALEVVATYREIGRGWSTKRLRVPAHAGGCAPGAVRHDRLLENRSPYQELVSPLPALIEVVETYRIRLESVMDAIDTKLFPLMAAIGKMELDSLRERSSLGKRGAARHGRIPTGSIPYGYCVGAGGRPVVVEAEAEVVRRIFRQYVHEGIGAPTIAWQLTDEGIPTRQSGKRWQAFLCPPSSRERGLHGHVVVWQEEEDRDRRRDKGPPAAGGDMDTHPIPAAGG